MLLDNANLFLGQLEIYEFKNKYYYWDNCLMTRYTYLSLKFRC